MYRLKDTVPEFEVVDGPLAGRIFRHGETYTEIPPQEKTRFEKVKVKVGKEETKNRGGKKR